MFWSARFRSDSRLASHLSPEVADLEKPPVQAGRAGYETGSSGPEPTARKRASFSRLRSWDRDVRLGAGMVAAFCVFVACTSPLLHLSPQTGRRVVFVVAVVAVADFGLLLLRWERFTWRMLLIFPVLLLAGEMALSLFTKGVAAEYAGFLTLAFVYIGLTQPLGAGLVFSLLAIPSWVVIQQHWATGLAIKLCLTVAVWLLLSGFLAVRTNRDLKLSRRLVKNAYTDVLTGLGNRRALAERVEHLVADASCSGSSLLLIDLDGFKKVNDTFGHLVGDELLVVAAKRINSHIRDDDLAVRLGGDEFSVVVEHGGIDEAKRVAARIVSSVAAPIALSRIRLSVTASVGIVEILPSSKLENVLNHADLAMYQAKAAGRNQVMVYEDGLHTRMVQRLELEGELVDAVDKGEFEQYYQPIVHMGTGAIIGVEGLVRWHHPRRGLLLPGDFLLACQELGLMQTLGERLLLTACQKARRWQPIDPADAVSLAFNLSADEVFAPGLVARVETALEASGLHPGLLILEITEQIVMADKVRARRAMLDLQSLGVRIAIDDFGTGYSSLAYLREFPVNILKIDRSFVAPLGTDTRALALFQSILSIAEALSLDVIVEGVETRLQAELLVDLGCLVAQGFYFERPKAADDLAGSAELWPRCLPV